MKELEIRINHLETNLFEINKKLDAISTALSKFQGAMEAKTSFVQTTFKVLQIIISLELGAYLLKSLNLGL